MTFLFDLDSTLADDSHRSHLYNKSNTEEQWRYFYSLIPLDKPILPSIAIAKSLYQNGHTLVGITGRRESSRALTKKWLLHHAVFFDNLYMRAEKDFSSNAEFKRNALKEIRQHYVPIAVFEDNPSSAAMWKEEGLLVYHVR